MRPRCRAFLPYAVAIGGTGLLFGGEALLPAGASTLGIGGAETATAGATVEAAYAAGPIAVEEAAATLPPGINQAMFGKLAGFTQGKINSSLASTETTAEVLATLKAAGVTRASIFAFLRFYLGAAAENAKKSFSRAPS
jgi:hypothetical protein